MTSRCQICHGKHHTSICSGSINHGELTRGAATSSPTESQSATESTTSNFNPSAPEFTPTESHPRTSALCADANKPVLLQTASAVVSNPHDSSASTKLRIVMDSGSQRSYLTHGARGTLHLPTTDKQRLAIEAFGSKRGDPRLCEVVQVSVKTRDGGDKKIDLFVVPHICEPLTTQPIGKCLELHPHISELDLADDPMDETREIDMLIGSDFHWEFVTGEVVKGGEVLWLSVLHYTTLGWMLSGPANLTGCRELTVNLITTHTLRVDVGVNQQDVGCDNEQWRIQDF